jgi:hypothetical protein
VPGKHRLIGILIFLSLEGVAFWGMLASGPPDATPLNAPAEEFSSARAMKHLEEIARAPHPVGSIEHARVRNEIIKTLLSMGLDPVTSSPQRISGANSDGQSVPLVNILCLVPGHDTSGAVLLAAHYDSVPGSPGAADDGAAVAALLETMRALEAGPPLRNDVILLLTDGEEQGLRGAKGFVGEHPWATSVRFVLNFEARGNSGASVMFETSSGNGRIVGEFGRAVDSPVSSSLAYDVYKRLPNDTDFTVFRNAGYRGLNFAFIDGADAYHDDLDTVENLSERSLQHHGEQALALTRHFGNIDISDLSGDDEVFFHLPFGLFVHYSNAFAQWSAACILLLVLATLVHGFRRRVLTLSGFILGLLGMLTWLRVAVVAIVLLWLGHMVVSKAGLLDDLVPHGESLRSVLLVLGLWNVVLALTPFAAPWRKNRERLVEPIAAALVLWSALLVVAVVRAPGTSYLVAWPLFFATIPLTWLVTRGRDSWPCSRGALICWVVGVPIVHLFITHEYLFFLAAVPAHPPPLIGLGVAVTMGTLAVTLIQPQLFLIERSSKRLLPIGAAMIAALAFLAALL